jgi:carbon storage regulator
MAKKAPDEVNTSAQEFFISCLSPATGPSVHVGPAPAFCVEGCSHCLVADTRFALAGITTQEEKVMLVLTRRVGEAIIIEGGIRVTVVSVQGEKVRVGIDAPPDVQVDRQEVHERRRVGEPFEVAVCMAGS